MRRLWLLVAAGTLWLFLAAVPALADGGPHQVSRNSGTSTLTSDSCAGCHRAHTASGPYLINAPTEEDLCLGCHGTAGQGATTNVEDGVQYSLADGSQVVAGALRGGGFVNARIGSDDPTRVPYPRDGGFGVTGVQLAISFSSRVPVGPSDPVTSAHIDMAGGVTSQGKAWGNGGLNTGAGPVMTLECASCHNPHGNGQYRILNPIPSDGTGDLVEATIPATVAEVRTAPTGPTEADATRNYTVKWGITLQDVVANDYPNPSSPDGDYWRRLQPWDAIPTWNGVEDSGLAADLIQNPANYWSGDMPEFIGAPNTGGPATSTAFNSGLSTWCLTCHTRYLGTSTPASYSTDSGDDIFTYRHGTQRTACTTCHVAHGSNADMPGDGITAFSANFPYPDSTDAAPNLDDSSRLLKVDNRGTCQQCHDPTNTVLWDDPAINNP